ncbi:MAG: hypothetical protein ACRD2Z_12655 [Thermoanaerobaculia bacterium]
MSRKPFALVLLATGALAGPACSGAAVEMGEAVEVSVQCVVDYAPAQSCTLRDRVEPDGTHVMTFVTADARTRFTGKSQSGWWSGRLNGRPAMGYELNRGHIVYSTIDLTMTFEWWSAGHEHGSY